MFYVIIDCASGDFRHGILSFDEPVVEQEPEIVFEIEQPEYLPDIYEITEEKKIEQTIEEPKPEESEKILEENKRS